MPVGINCFDAVPGGHRPALGHRVDADHPVAEMPADPGGELPDRAEAEDNQCAAVGDVRVLHGLPCGRQNVGQEQVTLVRAVRADLDRPVLRLRHPEVLGLPTGHRPVQRGVAEQRGTLASGDVTWVVSHCDCSPSRHITQWPQEMLNGTTTRSPGLICVTAEPTSCTMPIGSWPRMSPAVMYGPSTSYRCRSEPQIAVEVILTMASVGSWMVGSGTSSTRTSRLPCQVTAFMVNLLSSNLLRGAGSFGGRAGMAGASGSLRPGHSVRC